MKPSCKTCKNINCFIKSNFSIAKISSLDKLKTTTELKKGEYVYRKNGKAKEVYMLYRGCVELIKKSENGSKGTIFFVEPGELFGYRSVLSEEPHNTSAKVYRNSQICVLKELDFFRLFESNKGLAKKFMKFLSKQFRAREKKLDRRIT